MIGLHSVLDLGVDVLKHHDGVVDHQTDGKDNPQQCEHIDGEASDIHDEKGPDERNGNGDDGDDGRTPVAQEQEYDQHDQREGDVDGLQHLVDRLAYVFGDVEAHGQLDVVRQVKFDLLDARIEFVGDGNVVGTGLRNQHHTHHGHAVALEHGAFILGTELCPSDIPETDDGVTALKDDQVVEIFGGLQKAYRPDRELGGIAFDATAGKFHIFALERLPDVARRELVGTELGGVHPQTHGIPFGTPDLDIRHPRYGLKPLLEDVVGDFGEFKRVARVAAHAQEHDWARVGVGFRDNRVVDLRRQTPSCPAHPVAHIVCGIFEWDLQVEFDGDGAHTLAAYRRDASYARNAVDALLEGLGDLRLHDVGIGAGVRCGYGDDGGIDRGVLAYTQV